jgi:hypothetical protein
MRFYRVGVAAPAGRARHIHDGQLHEHERGESRRAAVTRG